MKGNERGWVEQLQQLVLEFAGLRERTLGLDRVPLVLGTLAGNRSGREAGGRQADSEAATPASRVVRAAPGLPGGASAAQAVLAGMAGGGLASRLLSWLSPLTALVGLFRRDRGEQAVPAAWPQFEPRNGIRRTWGIAGETHWQFRESEYDSTGRARLAPPTAAAPTVTIQVQAIDSRSFLDHSDAIAEAVKKSLLESHGLADTLRELS